MADSSTHSRPTAPNSGELPIPPNLKQKLEAFQSRLWSIKIAEGALAGLAGLGFSYLLTFVLDRLFDTPTLLRVIILLAGFGIPAIGLPLRWHRWISQQKSLEQIARLLRRKFPRLGDELLGIVELSHSQKGNNSPVLVEAAMKQVDERIAKRELDDAVPDNHYRTWLTGALAVISLAAALTVFVSDAAQNTLARWVSPWKPVDRYTFAQLEQLPDKVIVPYAENFNLSPALSETTEWKPGRASVRLPGKTSLRADREDNFYHFDVPPQKENGQLGVRVGDEFKRVEVNPLPRPELVDIGASLRLPDYLRYSSDPILPIRGGSVSIVEGARASFRGTTSRELANASADGISTSIDGASFATDHLPIEEPQTHTFTWTDIHGLQAKSPLELNVTPVPDEAPDVFARQVSEERIVLPDEVVTFDVSATDDFGLKAMGLQWWGASDPETKPDPVSGEKPVAAGAPEARELESTATFSAEREGIKPQTIQVRAFAEDFLPNRERSYSPTFVLHILSPEDHANWLTQEFGKWFRNAREVYEREQQLHETNRELRELSAEELDQPENRRRLREQSSAESMNGRRLESLSDSGRGLVKQATKNDEFDAERLESWSTMMRALDEIAKERMPNVSDLLQQAAQSAGQSGQSSQGGDKNSPSKSKPSGEQSTPPAPQVENKGKNQSQGEGDGESNPNSNPPSPGISDQVSSLDKPPEGEKPKQNQGAKPSAPLGLPKTTLGPAGDGKQTEPQETPAQAKLSEALEKQKDLLAEFAKVADQLQEILSSLEASTFVKRFKAASRKQFEIADTLNETLDAGFGLPRHRIEQQLRAVGEKASLEQDEQARSIYSIQTDLEAYFQRKQDLIYKNVLDQMRDMSVVADVKVISEELLVNFSGRSISASEFWGDTLDRWAEELVAASEYEACQGGEKDSLPPELVLKIMKVLQEEMYLRDETREMEAARLALAPDVYESKVRPLELTQEDLRERVDEVILEIEELPNAREHFMNEMQLLSLVSDVMRQARAVLARPDTGMEAIAAETEVIELLLQSNRQKNSGGGGGGSSPGGGAEASSNGASLNDISLDGGESRASGPSDRAADQSTGQTGRKLPEEFRRGLDQYFNALESN
ncbi:MAG: hypothetical protein ACPGFB_12310 [Verrucomicrobiales bacterium]